MKRLLIPSLLFASSVLTLDASDLTLPLVFSDNMIVPYALKGVVWYQSR